MSVFISRDVVFNEVLILQERLKMKDKTQGGAPDTSADSQEKEIEFLDSSKKLNGSDGIPQSQMETNRRLLSSNLNC